MQRPASTPSLNLYMMIEAWMVDDLHDAAGGSGLGVARAEDEA